MPLRKLFFWFHLAAGVLSGAVILTMSVTGVLLAFERQIVGAAERDLRTADPAAAPLPPSQLLAAAGAKGGPAPASNLTLRSDPHAPAVIAFGREKTLFVDRSTGIVLGEGATGLRHFFGVVEDVHRWLAFKDDARPRAKAVVGAANLLFFFILLSGLYIWIPRTRAALRNNSRFRRRLRGKARDFNWHNVLGVWSFLPLLLIVFSGVVISYPWASRLVYRAFGSSEPPRPQQPEGRGERGRRVPIDGTAVDKITAAALAEAGRVAPRWQSVSLRLPLPRKGSVTVAVDEGNGTRPDKRSQLLFDAKTGLPTEHKTYASQERGQQARAWLRWIHTGEAGGIGGQTVAMLASAAATVLVWTGIALALRRLRKWKRKERLA
jgi:uncharacterized iron-regulated membrane protein